MADLRQIRVCGFGGQGVVLAGTILGHAAINDGKWVSGSNAYGAQARGGSARSEVVISRDPVKFPHVIKSDILISLSQSAYDEYIKDIRDAGAVIIYDDLMVNPQDLKHARQIAVPATNTAIRELDNKQVANIVIIGAFAAITGIVTQKSLISAIKGNVGDRFRELNLKALEVGYRLGEDIKQGIGSKEQEVRSQEYAVRSKHNKLNKPDKHKEPKIAVEGRTHKPVIDHDKCNICSICLKVCPDLCITRNENTGQIEIDYDFCKGCDICAFICPKGAITMVLEE
jgi:2-oxoglutarate ferredoxin oxidoreductase subunit gamma